MVLSHARALLTSDDGVTAVAADLRDPAAVLAHPELRAAIDLAEPVGVILGAVLTMLSRSSPGWRWWGRKVRAYIFCDWEHADDPVSDESPTWRAGAAEDPTES